MAFTPDIIEQLARARADLRMGVPVVLTGDGAALVLAAETLTPQRLADVLALGGTPVLAITARRAETLKARPYDGDLARLTLPMDASLAWVQAIADPADDLRSPMKGPLISARDGDALAHRAALALCKSARLLPAAVVLPLDDAGPFATQHALTTLPLARLSPPACRWRRPKRGGCIFSVPKMARRNITPLKSAAPTAASPCGRDCIPPVSPVTFWDRSNATAARNCAARWRRWARRARAFYCT